MSFQGCPDHSGQAEHLLRKAEARRPKAWWAGGVLGSSPCGCNWFSSSLSLPSACSCCCSGPLCIPSLTLYFCRCDSWGHPIPPPSLPHPVLPAFSLSAPGGRYLVSLTPTNPRQIGRGCSGLGPGGGSWAYANRMFRTFGPSGVPLLGP